MTLTEKLSRERVKGFLRAKGREIVNGDGEPVILSGWGLGNWLLCEGYMWKAGPGADRPRRIEQVVRELAGSEYAESFWPRFRANYITRADIHRMAEYGCNSLRLPINWRVLMADEPGVTWLEEGFRLIDDLLDWCEEEKIYVFLDLHGAPGGQTGANIDDSVDDFPRLFTDEDSWKKAVALWGELARRYCGRWIVGGYDLLNEPIRPDDGRKECGHLVPRLIAFYETVIREIRKYDPRHMLTIEGHNWSTNPAVFDREYDDNYCIHFHRYAVLPDESAYDEWLKLSETWNKPLWLGESGENTPEWFAALYPLGARLGVGYNVWPWKKMACDNSPCSVKMPENWEKFTAYTGGGERPSYGEAQAMFDEYLENMKLENCVENPAVNASVRREPGCTLRAVDFDRCSGGGVPDPDSPYRKDSGMRIVGPAEQPEKRFGFDCGWDSLTLSLSAGEWVEYSFFRSAGAILTVETDGDVGGGIEVFQDGCALGKIASGKEEFRLAAADETVIRLRCTGGTAVIKRLKYLRETR